MSVFRLVGQGTGLAFMPNMPILGRNYCYLNTAISYKSTCQPSGQFALNTRKLTDSSSFNPPIGDRDFCDTAPSNIFPVILLFFYLSTNLIISPLVMI